MPDAGRALYGEDVYVGYRFYEKVKREVAFPFGHGLSYARFAFVPESLRVADDDGETVVVEIAVRNDSEDRAGAQVVQVYVAPPPDCAVARPVKELKGFAKTRVLGPGEAQTVRVELRKKYAAAYWDEGREEWCVEKGTYRVLVGDSSAHTPVEGAFEVGETVWWRGL
ncbi:beta-glucosidase [Diplodia seriata]